MEAARSAGGAPTRVSVQVVRSKLSGALLQLARQVACGRGRGLRPHAAGQHLHVGPGGREGAVVELAGMGQAGVPAGRNQAGDGTSLQSAQGHIGAVRKHSTLPSAGSANTHTSALSLLACSAWHCCPCIHCAVHSPPPPPPNTHIHPHTHTPHLHRHVHPKIRAALPHKVLEVGHLLPADATAEARQ